MRDAEVIAAADEHGLPWSSPACATSGTEPAAVDPLPQRCRDFGKDARPIAPRLLPEKPHGRVPGSIGAVSEASASRGRG